MAHATHKPYSDYLLGLALQLVTQLSTDTYDSKLVAGILAAMASHLENSK